MMSSEYESAVTLKNKNKKEKKTITVLIPALMAIALFVVLVMYQESILRGYDNAKMVVAIAEIPERTNITKDNVGQYFKVKDVRKSLKVEGAVNDTEKLIGLTTTNKILKNQVISTEWFVNPEDYILSLNNPIEMSVGVEKASDAVGGTLRSGDYVDVNVIIDGKSEKVIEGAYVKTALDSSNAVAEESDSVATTFILVIDESNKARLSEKLDAGQVFVTLPNKEK